MATIIDNTGTETLVDLGGIVWVKTTYSSYRNYRTERFFVGEAASKYWKLWVDGGKPRPEVFTKPEEAMRFAASLTNEN